MKKQIILAFILSFWVAFVLAACTSPAAPTPATNISSTASGALDGKALTESRCSACHSLNRVEQKHRASDWPILVDTMINRGAQLNSAEKAAVIDYLTKNFSN